MIDIEPHRCDPTNGFGDNRFGAGCSRAMPYAMLRDRRQRTVRDCAPFHSVLNLITRTVGCERWKTAGFSVSACGAQGGPQ